HARQWAPLPALAVHAALGLPLHQAGPLESLLHPGVAQSDPVFLAQLLVEMTHVQIEILLSIQFQNLLGLSLRHPLMAGHTPPPVQQSIVATIFIAFSPTTQLTVADADHLCRLPPHNLPCGSSQQHFFYLHRPLHGGRRIVLHAQSHGSILAARYADISLATTTGHIMC